MTPANFESCFTVSIDLFIFKLLSRLRNVEPGSVVQHNSGSRRDVQRLHLGIRRDLDLKRRGIPKRFRATVLFTAKDDHERSREGGDFIDQMIRLRCHNKDWKLLLIAEADKFCRGRGHNRQREDMSAAGTNDPSIVNIHRLSIQQDNTANPKCKRGADDRTNVPGDTLSLQEQQYRAASLPEESKPGAGWCMSNGKYTRDFIILKELFAGSLRNFMNTYMDW